MADNHDDDDEFDLDDALDDLQDDDLVELEREAFLSTQRNLNNSHVLNNSQRLRHFKNEDSFASDKTLQPNKPPSDYGFDDEDIIDLDEQPLAVQQAYHQGSAYNAYLGKQESHTLYGGAQGGESFRTAVEDQNVDVAALQAALLQVCRCIVLLGSMRVNERRKFWTKLQSQKLLVRPELLPLHRPMSSTSGSFCLQIYA
jgi:hypothetical protein